MPVEYIKLTKHRYDQLGYEPYRWVRNDAPVKLQPLPRSLRNCRLGLVVSSGAYLAGQVAFHHKDDTSIREIPKDADLSDLRFSHLSDHFLGDARSDPNCLVPISALRRLEAVDAVGEVAGTVLSCMGGIYSQRKVREQLAPVLLEALRIQQVEAALLVPMCPVCHQTMAIVARYLEAAGISTVCIASALDIVETARPPRTVFVDFPLGHTVGKPFDRSLQAEIVSCGLEAFETISESGGVVNFPAQWDEDDSWKDEVRKNAEGDQRPVRDTTPRYQFPADRELAERNAAIAGAKHAV